MTSTSTLRSPAALVALLVIGAALSGCIGNDISLDSSDAEQAPSDDGLGAERNWTSRNDVPTPRTEVASTIVDGELLVVAGEDANRASRAVEALDLETGTWRSLPELPIPLHHTTAVTVDGEVHVFGGFAGIGFFTPTPTHFVWAPGEESWQVEDPMPRVRAGHGAAVLEGNVYLVGGLGSGMQHIEAVDVFEPDNGTWSKAEPLPTPRDHLAVAATQAGVHAVGGRETNANFEFDFNNKPVHEVLDPGEGWTTSTPMPTARGGTDAAVLDGRLVVVGGEGPNGTFEEVEAFDPATGHWSALPPLPTPRHGLGVESHEGDLYTVAGGPEPGFTLSAAVEVLEAGPVSEDTKSPREDVAPPATTLTGVRTDS